MEEKKFQFLSLLFFGVLVLTTGLFLSQSELNPATSFAVVNTGSETTIMMLIGVLSLTILAFLLKFRGQLK